MKKSSQSTRREFLRNSSYAAAAGAAVPYFAWSQPAFANCAANDRPRIGCIGIGGMGTGDAHEHNHFGDIVAVCDVDAGHASAARNDGEIGKGKADQYGDYRKVLDRNDIDVVSVVTPDHWHVKIAIEALEAGKHVFCQKPLTLTLEESQLIRNAVAKHKDKVFIVGTQQRSDRDRFLRAINMVQKGLLGEIKKITVGINGGDVGGPFKKEKPPKELDWNFWLGQAPKVDYIKERCHYQFRWWYEYSGGKFTDWGAHHVDIATWAIEQNKQGMGPIEIDGSDAKHPVPFKDGYPTVDDCYNTSHDFAVKCKFANGIEMIDRQPQPERHPLRGSEGAHLRRSRQDHRQADRRELGQRQVRPRRPHAALQRQALRRAQGEFLPLHSRRGPAGVRRLQPRHGPEHLPPLRRSPRGSAARSNGTRKRKKSSATTKPPPSLPASSAKDSRSCECQCSFCPPL